jgi:hypothetical protein
MSAPNLNPMGLTSGIWPGNYQHQDTLAHQNPAVTIIPPIVGNPLRIASITKYIHPNNPSAVAQLAPTTVNKNPMALTWPIPVFTEPLSIKDLPQNTRRKKWQPRPQ